ncbi:MAG: hypothetical protein EON96_21915, partial [Caulobacteraceae bacterium]
MAGDRVAGRPAKAAADDIRYGGSLGGPILKDRLFFFGAYEHSEVTFAQDDGPTGGGFPNERAFLTVDQFNEISDVLRDVPGVYAQKKWGADIRLSIRGSGVGNSSHNRGTLLAQDGIPFNEADGFGDFQLIDPSIARYTEVYKGGNALRFGGALLGGAINLVTPTGRTAGAANLVRIDWGSYDTMRAHAEMARASGDWDVFAAVTGQQAEGWRDQSLGQQQYGSLNIGRRLGEDREVRLYVSGGYVHQEIPGSVTLSDALTRPTVA